MSWAMMTFSYFQSMNGMNGHFKTQHGGQRKGSCYVKFVEKSNAGDASATGDKEEDTMLTSSMDSLGNESLQLKKNGK